MRFSHCLFLILIFLGACSTCRAEIFNYKDTDSGVSLHYPDEWERVHNQQPDDVLTVAAPSFNDEAICRMRVREDKRFMVYPREYAQSIQRVHYSTEFLDDYLNEYNDVSILNAQDDAQLGRGFGTYAEITYTPNLRDGERRQGIVFAAPYFGRLYVLDCSAKEERYGAWYPGFMAILRSVNFEKIIHEDVTGYYRNFMCDCPLHVHGPHPSDLYVQ